VNLPSEDGERAERCCAVLASKSILLECSLREYILPRLTRRMLVKSQGSPLYESPLMDGVMPTVVAARDDSRSEYLHACKQIFLVRRKHNEIWRGGRRVGSERAREVGSR
jgi:hypothetical protein